MGCLDPDSSSNTSGAKAGKTTKAQNTAAKYGPTRGASPIQKSSARTPNSRNARMNGRTGGHVHKGRY